MDPTMLEAAKVAPEKCDKLTHLENRVQALCRRREKKSTAEIQEALDLIMQKHDMEPAEELVKMVMEKQDDGQWVLTNDQRIKILTDLTQYRMPKLKSVEVAGNVNHKHEIIIVRYGEDGKVSRDSKGPAPEVAKGREQPMIEAEVVQGGNGE